MAAEEERDVILQAIEHCLVKDQKLTVKTDEPWHYFKLLLDKDDTEEDGEQQCWFHQEDYLTVKARNVDTKEIVAVKFPKNSEVKGRMCEDFGLLHHLMRNNTPNVQRPIAKTDDFMVCQWAGVPLTSMPHTKRSELQALNLFYLLLWAISNNAPHTSIQRNVLCNIMLDEDNKDKDKRIMIWPQVFRRNKVCRAHVSGQALANVLYFLLDGKELTALPPQDSVYKIPADQRKTSTYDVQVGALLDDLRSQRDNRADIHEEMKRVQRQVNRLERLRDDKDDELLKRTILLEADKYPINTGEGAYQSFRACNDNAIVVQAAEEDSSYVVCTGGRGEDYTIHTVSPASNMTLLMALNTLAANACERLKMFRCMINENMVCPTGDLTYYLVSRFNLPNMKITCVLHNKGSREHKEMTCLEMFDRLMSPVSVSLPCNWGTTYQDLVDTVDNMLQEYNKVDALEKVLDKIPEPKRRFA